MKRVRKMEMKKIGLMVLVLIGINLPGALAQECRPDEPRGEVIGYLVNARENPDTEQELSGENREVFRKAGMFGPLLVLIEEGTGKVRPFYYGDENLTIEESVAEAEPYVGQRIRARGCISESNWPSILGATAEVV